MFKEVKGGEKVVIQGIECWIPPVGYGVDRITGELRKIGVYSASPKQKEQKWKRIPLPADYDKKRYKEVSRIEGDPEYFDPELEAIREKHWMWRRCGFWFKNNGVDTYITGTHWYYLNWCVTNIGYMDYRNTDRKLFYCMRSIEEDPRCGGGVYVSRRRQGKSYVSGALMLDKISMSLDKIGGIQSKTDTDAQLLFSKTIVNYFVNMPHFFRPVYDNSQGLRPKKELRFYKPTIKGKKSDNMLEGDELRSSINYGSSNSFHYDGNALGFYVMDEFGKPSNADVWETLQVVRFCIDQDGRWVGKMFVTSTIEDLDTTGQGPKKIWDNSNQFERDGNGRTKSGLYRIFFGAHESTFFDEYGNEDTERGMEYYLNMRKGLQHDTRALSSVIRKNPFTIEEAFRIDGETCIYDAMLLNERLDKLSWKDNVATRGNFVWENGVRDSRVVFQPQQNGRFEVVYLFDDDTQSNKILKRGEKFHPNNQRFISGCDPYDHQAVQDGKMSNGAGSVLKRFSPVEDKYNNSFVCMYCNRPDSPKIFYEDMIMMCVYYGCQILVENNKVGVMTYFADRGYENFLMWLPERAQPGIAASLKTTQYMAEVTDDYIRSSIDNVFFKDLIKDWLEFDVNNTTKFDLGMCAGYALIADKSVAIKKDKEAVYEVSEYFKKNKIPR